MSEIIEFPLKTPVKTIVERLRGYCENGQVDGIVAGIYTPEKGYKILFTGGCPIIELVGLLEATKQELLRLMQGD